MIQNSGVALYIDPATHHFLGDRLFDSRTNPYSGENILGPFLALRDHFTAKGIPVHTADFIETSETAARKVYVSFGALSNFRRLAKRRDTVLSAFFAMECPIVEPSLYRALPDVQRYFKRTLTWSDSASLEPFVGRPLGYERFLWPQCFNGVHEEIWARTDRKFLVMINANKLPRLYRQELYTERLKAVEFFQRYGEIDLYGRNWDRMPNRVGKTWVPWTARRIYRVLWEARQRRWPDPIYAAAEAASKGPVASKSETLGRYMFALCFENMILTGWITEKIFDCFFAGTVPIYWGAPDILEWIPAECFIDMRRFKGYSELRAFLHGLEPREISGYREAARAFLESPRFDPFRTRTFVDLLRRIVREDAGLDT